MQERTGSTFLVQFLSKAAMAVWAAVALLHIEGAQAKTPLSIELVFAVDTSMSIDGFEFGLLMKGIANAFRTPEVVDLIGQQDGVAVTLFQWSSEVNEQYMIPWHLLKDPASVLAFAAKVEKAERDPDRVFTGLCSVRSGNLASPRAGVYPGAGRSVILVIHESVQTNMENQYAERPG